MKKGSVHHILRQKQGAALLTVLVIFFTLLVVVTSTIMISSSNFKQSRSTNKFASSFYVAESGLNESAFVLEQIVQDAVNRTSSRSLFEKFVDEMEAYNPTVIHEASNIVGVEFSVDYGSVMGADASVHIQFIENNGQYILTSTGVLGDHSRTISRSFALVGTSQPSPSPDGPTIIFEETVFAKDSVVAIDLTGESNNTLGLNPSIPNLKGPFVTNRIYEPTNRVTIQSAFVTNNNVGMRQGMNLEGILISSGEILVNTSGGNSSLNALIVKRGGKIKINIAYTSALNHIGYVLIPEEYKDNLDEVITYDQSGSDYLVGVNKGAYDRFKSRMIFYKQDDFNPWDLSHYSKDSVLQVDEALIREIFGEKQSSTDYSIYFAQDFILDNLDDTNRVETVYPDVSIPSPPLTNESTHYNTTGRDIVVSQTGSPNTTHTLVTKNNEFSYSSNITYNTNFRTLDLSEGTQNVYSFEAFEILAPFSTGNNVLTIDVGSKDVMIVTKTLRIPTASFNIVGEGTLSFYITGTGTYVQPSDIDLRIITLMVNGQVANKTELSTKLNIFVGEARGANGSPFKIQIGSSGSGNSLAMTIYSQNLSVDFQSNFYGSFISLEGEEISMGWVHTESPVIYAPKALFASESTTVGKIIVSNFDLSRPGSISFEGGGTTELYHEVLSVILQNPSSSEPPNPPETPETPEDPGDQDTQPPLETPDLTTQSIQWGPTIEVGRSN